MVIKVEIVDNRVRVFLKDKNIYIKKDGEEEFEFDSKFWEWLEEKIDDEFEVELVSNKNIELPSNIKIYQKKEKTFKKNSDIVEYFIKKTKQYR